MNMSDHFLCELKLYLLIRRLIHMESRHLIPHEFISKPPDIMLITYNLGMQFKLVINNTQTCITNVQQLGQDSLAWFNDGSKMDAGVGEVKGYNPCNQKWPEKTLEVARLYILSDSSTESSEVIHIWLQADLGLQTVPKATGSENSVTMIWVPGHKGIISKEKADILAKERVNITFPGLEPFGRLSKRHMKEEPRRCDLNQEERYWNKVPKQRKVKSLISLSVKNTTHFLDQKWSKTGNGTVPSTLPTEIPNQ